LRGKTKNRDDDDREFGVHEKKIEGQNHCFETLSKHVVRPIKSAQDSEANPEIWVAMLGKVGCSKKKKNWGQIFESVSKHIDLSGPLNLLQIERED